MPKSRVPPLIVTALVLLVATPCVVLLDHVLSQPDRLLAARRADDLLSLQDALLKYEFDRGVLPARLQDLVPLYVRANQLTADGADLFGFDAAHRVVGLAAPVRIRGVWSRQRVIPGRILPPPPPALPVQPAAAAATTAGGVLLAPAEPANAAAPPAGALVFEAENYSETTYGWEVHPDPACGGGAYLHTKEGMGNGPGQIGGKIRNFYDIREGDEYSRVRIRFHLDKPGTYTISCRLWTTGSHCSNNIILGLDLDDPTPVPGSAYSGWGLGNQTPFRWLWTQAGGGPVPISAGDHYLHLYPHEDGIKFDQFMLSPEPVTGDAVYRANLRPNAGTAFAMDAGPPVHLTFDLKSMLITAETPPVCSLAVRRLRSASGAAVARLALRAAGADGKDLPLGTQRVDLGTLPELCFLPVDFAALKLAALPRREYLLTAELVQGEKTLAACRVPLMHPYAWELSPMLPYIAQAEAGPLDAAAAPPASLGPNPWKPIADSSWDLFGVMDFGLHTSNNSLHAPEKVAIYAQTRIHVPAPGTYLFKIQSDDQLILWIDGREAGRNNGEGPVTRSVVRLPLRLEAGEHRLRIRVNQRQFTSYGDGRWQASLRIRTLADELSCVTGLPPETGVPAPLR